MAAAPDLDVRYIAQLARLDLSDEEITTFQAQLDHVLEHVEALRRVDVTSVEPTAHASAVFNVFRQDSSRKSFPPETALGNAPRRANDLFVVTKVVE